MEWGAKMTLFQIDNVSQSFPLPAGGEYIALKNVSIEIKEGEFVSLIGHSGCGKSTLLNLLAGLTQATRGGILMNGRQITDPGPDRMVVFQNYSLLPWQTARQNIALAVDNANSDATKEEKQEAIESALSLVGLSQAADKYPRELSGGMKQRVAIARALSISPKLLLLDEPFGALDALTRGNLQQQLMEICQKAKTTTVMVTHDVDEALLLSDRVICLTNGPEAKIGKILKVPFARPRERLAVMEDENYYQLRRELIGFLQQERRLKQPSKARPSLSVVKPTKSASEINLGIIKGLDIAPLALALELNLIDQKKCIINKIVFQDWQKLEDSLVNNTIDLAITSATTPLKLNLGLGSYGSRQKPWPAITPMTVSRNGNALCIAKKYLNYGVQDLPSLAAYLNDSSEALIIGVPQRFGMSELLLRHWLTSGGVDVDKSINFIVITPSLMVGAIRTEQVDAFNAGRYRVAEAVADKHGYVIATDLDIWAGHPEKVVTTSSDWAEINSDALTYFCTGLMKAAELCDNPFHRDQLNALLSQPEWLGTRSSLALQTQFDNGMDESPKPLLRLNQFYTNNTSLPDRAEGSWMLSQLSRWHQCAFPINSYELLENVYRLNLYEQILAEAGHQAISGRRPPFSLSDGIEFDQDNPIEYLSQLPDKVKPELATLTLPIESETYTRAAGTK